MSGAIPPLPSWRGQGRFSFFLCRYSPTGAQAASFLKVLNHTQLDTHPVDCSGGVIGPSRRPLPTQHATNTRDVHASPERDLNLAMPGRRPTR